MLHPLYLVASRELFPWAENLTEPSSRAMRSQPLESQAATSRFPESLPMELMRVGIQDNQHQMVDINAQHESLRVDYRNAASCVMVAAGCSDMKPLPMLTTPCPGGRTWLRNTELMKVSPRDEVRTGLMERSNS